jgi:hypothetical protein
MGSDHAPGCFMTINHTMRIIRRQGIRLDLASDRIAVSRVALAALDHVHAAIARRECQSLLLHERDPALVLLMGPRRRTTPNPPSPTSSWLGEAGR